MRRIGGILMVDTDMYQGPIRLIYSDVQRQVEKQVEKFVLTEVQKVGVDVDKDELLKALAYDRGQYEKGRADALASIVRCKDCKWHGTVDCPLCEAFDPSLPDDWYCPEGKRRDEDEE